MKKDAYYFPHFCNARHDRKIKRITKELGVEGYGIYFMILEVLREQSEMKYPIEDIDLLADEFRTSEQKVRTVICNYDLFTVDDDQMFFSPKLFLYLEPYFKMKKQRINAGRRSAEVRKMRLLEQPPNDRSATAEQSKVKKSKVKNIEERKDMFKQEIAKLKGEFSSHTLKDFYNYWTELNKSQTKMRFELEKTWELKKRIQRWAKNEKVEAVDKIPPQMANIKNYGK